MITERQMNVLIGIVEEYVKTNEPVGSFILAKRPELNFSTATIRSEMAVLEELGYLEKTHTSSGRVPSVSGYRKYVREIMNRENIKTSNYPMIDEIFERPNITKDEAIYESMELVSELTNYTSIVLGKTAYSSRIKRLEFISLRDQYAVILMVTDHGHVESKRIVVPDGVSVKEIEKVIKILDELLHNVLVSDIKQIFQETITNDQIRDYIMYNEELVRAFINAFSEMADDRFKVSGRYKILEQPEFKNTDKVKDIFEAFENKDILRVVSGDSNSVVVKIGNENELKIMQDCSVISVPYEAKDGSIGRISIVGPTRMEYQKIIPLLEYISLNIKKII